MFWRPLYSWTEGTLKSSGSHFRTFNSPETSKPAKRRGLIATFFKFGIFECITLPKEVDLVQEIVSTQQIRHGWNFCRSELRRSHITINSSFRVSIPDSRGGDLHMWMLKMPMGAEPTPGSQWRHCPWWHHKGQIATNVFLLTLTSRHPPTPLSDSPPLFARWWFEWPLILLGVPTLGRKLNFIFLLVDSPPPPPSPSPTA